MIAKTLSHYKILDKLGEGGMGEVYRATDTTLKRQVALKVLPADLAASQERLERFQREAETLAALDHPNIVHIYSVEQAEGVRFLTMQLVEGKRLSELIPTGGMPLEGIFEIAIPLADALRAAHEKGVTHRDLKPGNVMVDDEGRVKILDFGLAKLRLPEPGPEASQLPTEAMTQEGLVLGTVPYMSPEQVQGEPVDHRTDIFSLGIMLYEMAAGLRPFRGENSAAVASSILRDTPAPVTEVKSGLPEQLGRIIRHCLEKDPERRFQSAKDVRNELEDLQREVTSRQAVVPRLPAPALALPGLRPRWLAVLGALLILAVLAGVYGWRTRQRPPEPEVPRIASLAVLPLHNLSGDPEQEYFADGMTEALITDLAKIGGLDKVISRTSVMRLKGSDKTMPEIARDLGVEAVLEGSVQRADGRVRITLQLIHAPTDRHLWSESYDRDLTDILALQSEVARAVTDEVRVTLTPREEQRLADTRPVNEEAYEAYLKGAHFLRSRLAEEDYTKAIGYFESAIEEDPTYAPAHVGLSKALKSLTFRYRPPIEVMPQAQAAVLRALELDDNLAEAHAQLGSIKLNWEWDWSGAEAEFRRALELSPNSLDVLDSYSALLTRVGRHEEAIALAKRAVELDPLNSRALSELGWNYSYARRYDDGVEHLLKTIELFPNDYWAHFYLSWNYCLQGLYAECLAAVERGGELHPSPNDDPFYLAGVTWCYGYAGRPREAAETLQLLLELRERSYAPPWLVAVAYVGIGDSDRAIEWLERAYAVRDSHLSLNKVIPAFDPLRDDPRFQDQLRRMNFPQ